MAVTTPQPSHEPPHKKTGTGHTDQTVEKLKEGGDGGGKKPPKSWHLML